MTIPAFCRFCTEIGLRCYVVAALYERRIDYLAAVADRRYSAISN